MGMMTDIRAAQASLLSQLPGTLQGCIEYRSIFRAVDAELDRLYAALQEVLDEQFIQTAKGEGLRRREAEFGIVPGDGASAEERRDALLFRTVERRPYTEAALHEMIASIVGGYAFTMETDAAAGTFLLTLQGNCKASLTAAEELLDRVLPLNLHRTVRVEEAATWHSLGQYTHEELGQLTHDEF